MNNFWPALTFVVGFIAFALGMLAGCIASERCKPVAKPIQTDELRKD